MSILELRFATGYSFGTTVPYVCWPASWIFASAYSTFRAGGPPTLDTIALETQLLLTHLHHQAGALLRPTEDFRTAPPHLARFLTEAAALAVTTDLGRVYGWNPGKWLLNMDDLPPSMSGLAPKGSKRPDILFNTHGSGAIAAESRGRSYASAPVGHPFKTETDRLSEIQTWAISVQRLLATPGPAQHFMNWLWIQPQGSIADFFDPGQPLELGSSQTTAATARAEAKIDQAYWQALELGHRQATVGDQPAVIVTRPVGFVSPDRFEWLAVAATRDSWSEPYPHPSTARYPVAVRDVEFLQQLATGLARENDARRARGGARYPLELSAELFEGVPLEEDVDVAVGTRLAATLISTSAAEEPNLSRIVDLIEGQIYG